MNQISCLSKISDADAEAVLSPETLAELAEHITSMPVRETRRPVRSTVRRRRLTAIAAIGVSAGVIAAGVSLEGVGGGGGPIGVGSAQAHALSFIADGRFIDVIVRNPLADPARYRAEFAAHHLNITLSLVPASPSIVGSVVYFDGGDQIKPITAVGRCVTGGGGDACPVGLKVPVDYRGAADLVFARAARPGERYESAGQVTSPGEALHGVAFVGKTVSSVTAILSARHISVAGYRTTSSAMPAPDHVPGTWHVYDAIPWAPDKVLLLVGPTATEPSAGPAAPDTPVTRPHTNTG